MSLTLTVSKRDIDEIQKRMRGLSSVQKGSVFFKAWEKASLRMEYGLKRWSLAGAILKVRTGRLRNSIQTSTTTSGGGIRSVIGSGARGMRRLPYANIHETGGVIKPKKGKFLWIPIRAGGDFAMASGASKKRVSYSSKTLGSIPVRSVTIPARRYLSRTVDKYGREVIEVLKSEVNAILEGKR